jgi:integrase
MPFPARQLTVNGETLPLNAWAARYSLDPETIRVRLDRLGWTAERAVTTPADKRFKRGGRPRADTPRPVPKARHHAPSGQARVRWVAFGREHTRYLGAWGSAAAKEEYRRFVAEWSAGTHDVPAPAAGAALTVAGLILRRMAFAGREYRKDGKRTSEYHCQRSALAPLNDLYGTSAAAEFDGPKLKAVRAEMVGKGWARGSINLHVSRVVSMFGWASGEGWLPAAVPDALREVPGLKAGKTEAPDRPPPKPVADADLAAVLPHLSPVPERRERVAAMIRLQRLTGMRPGEVCALRPCDLDMTGDVWLYTVDRANKNLHRGKSQRYWIGPRGQAEIRPYLDGPADRPIYRTSRGWYSVTVAQACERAGVKPWTPHKLRHALATQVAKEIGTLKAGADAIGDTEETAARHYVHVDPAERAKIEWARDRG